MQAATPERPPAAAAVQESQQVLESSEGEEVEPEPRRNLRSRAKPKARSIAIMAAPAPRRSPWPRTRAISREVQLEPQCGCNKGFLEDAPMYVDFAVAWDNRAEYEGEAERQERRQMQRAELGEKVEDEVP